MISRTIRRANQLPLSIVCSTQHIRCSWVIVGRRTLSTWKVVSGFSKYEVSSDGIVLFHSYHRKARAYITWQNINWTSNAQDTSGVSSSTTMIIVKESGVHCRNSDLVDPTIMYYNDYFDGNDYDTRLIDSYCAAMSMDFNISTSNASQY